MTARSGLRRFTGPAPEPVAANQPEARCEMCDTGIPDEHGHVVDLEQRGLLCACRACYLLFTRPTAARGRYRAVPDRYLRDPAHPISTTEWERLQIPISTAFFLRDGDGRLAGFYPGPAGATECLLDLTAWTELTSHHPLLGEPEPDVEAIVLRRIDTTIDCFLVPVDVCYELIGRMRLTWCGFDGGAEARASIAEFFAELNQRATIRTDGD